jgi:hypothetical protein
MKMKIVSMIVSLLLAFTVQAKDGPPPSTSIALPFDGQAKTNRAALASLAIRNVDNLVVEIYDAADADLDVNYNEPQRIIIPYPYAVKSFDDMCAKVSAELYHIRVVDTTKPVWVTVRFCKGDVTDRYGGYGDNARFQTLLYGQNDNGSIEEWKGGAYILSNGNIKMRLNSTIRMSEPGLIAGKVIHENGGSYSTPLRVYANGEFDLPVDVVGSGKVVMQGNFGNGMETIAESLVNGQRIEIDDVFIKLLLADSPEILTFGHQPSINLVVQSYNGRAVNPLIIVKVLVPCPQGYVCAPAPIQLSLQTTEGIEARSFRVININDKSEVTYSVPPNSPLKIEVKNNSQYHIIPNLPVVDTGGGKGVVSVGGLG